MGSQIPNQRGRAILRFGARSAAAIKLGRAARNQQPIRSLPLAICMTQLEGDSLEQTLDALVEAAFPSVPAGSICYHYTTMAAMRNILASQRFWLTAHEDTNDPAELVAADDAIISIAQDLLTSADERGKIVLAKFTERYSNLRVAKAVPTYLGCFSMSRDDANQWTNYGDGGRGVCLGVPILNEAPPTNPGLGHALLLVNYSEDSWRAHVRKKFIEILDLLSGSESTPENLAQAASAMFRIAAFEALSAKHSNWEVEHELRIAAVEDGRSAVTAPILERESKDRKVRYVEILVRQAGRRIALHEIITGSELNAVDAHREVEAALADAGYAPTDIEYPRIVQSTVAAQRSN